MMRGDRQINFTFGMSSKEMGPIAVPGFDPTLFSLAV